MKPEEFKAKVTEIMANLTDQGKVSTILADLTVDYDNVISTTEEANTKAAQLAADNESLRKSNMKLFTAMGSVPEKTTLPNDDEPKPVDWASLVNADGTLK